MPRKTKAQFVGPEDAVKEALEERAEKLGHRNGINDLEHYGEGKKQKNAFLKTKAQAELQWMAQDAHVSRDGICNQLLNRFKKKGYTFGYTIEEDFFGQEYLLDYGNMVIGTSKKQ